MLKERRNTRLEKCYGHVNIATAFSKSGVMGFKYQPVFNFGQSIYDCLSLMPSMLFCKVIASAVNRNSEVLLKIYQLGQSKNFISLASVA